MGHSVVVDIGGSGTRFAVLKDGRFSRIHRESIGSMEQLIESLQRIEPWPRHVAISVPGFVEHNTGTVRLSRVAPWLQGGLRESLEGSFPGTRAFVLNDGEAHAMSMLQHSDLKLGAISVALGTSLAFGVLDKAGQLLRPLNGENWDLGDFRLHTSAPDEAAWWALGAAGLRELKEKRPADALERFGYRLGGFLNQLTVIFRPRTIGLSGGHITGHWPAMRKFVAEEMNRLPAHLAGPMIRPAQAPEAALEGLAVMLRTL